MEAVLTEWSRSQSSNLAMMVNDLRFRSLTSIVLTRRIATSVADPVPATSASQPKPPPSLLSTTGTPARNLQRLQYERKRLRVQHGGGACSRAVAEEEAAAAAAPVAQALAAVLFNRPKGGQEPVAAGGQAEGQQLAAPAAALVRACGCGSD